MEPLFQVLRERGPEMTGKMKAASFVARHPHLIASALGAGLAAGLALSTPKPKRKKSLINVAYNGALVAGGASLAGEALRKSASAQDYVNMAVNFAKGQAQQHKAELIGAAIGAGVAAATGVISGRRFGGKPSFMERRSKEMKADLAADAARMRVLGKKPGFSHKLKSVYTKSYSGLSKAVAEHPNAGAALYGITGATLGAGIGPEVAGLLHKWRTA
jgi:hypothetical protein